MREDVFREYERIASRLADKVKVAILTQCLGGQLKAYIIIPSKHDQSTIKRSQQMTLGTTTLPSGDPDAMDANRIAYEKGSKKGKSKGTFEKGGKGKSISKGKFGKKGGKWWKQ